MQEKIGPTIRFPCLLTFSKQAPLLMGRVYWLYIDYTNRGIKEIAYTEIVTSLDSNIPSTKTKTNGLRAQVGQEIVKEKSSKSG